MSTLLEKIQKLDVYFQFYLNQKWRNPLFDIVMPMFSSASLLCGIVALVLAYIAVNRGKRALMSALKIVILVALAVGVTDMASGVIKDAAGRLRPQQAVAGCYYQQNGEWVCNPSDFSPQDSKGSSFTSGHAANTTAICLSLLLLLGHRMSAWQKGFFVILPFLVGWSRVYLGKHYVFDVLGGILVGCLTISLLWPLWKYVERRFFAHKEV